MHYRKEPKTWFTSVNSSQDWASRLVGHRLARRTTRGRVTWRITPSTIDKESTSLVDISTFGIWWRLWSFYGSIRAHGRKYFGHACPAAYHPMRFVSSMLCRGVRSAYHGCPDRDTPPPPRGGSERWLRHRRRHGTLDGEPPLACHLRRSGFGHGHVGLHFRGPILAGYPIPPQSLVQARPE